MGGYIRLMFVSETTLQADVVKEVTDSCWSHVAIVTERGLAEAVWPRVTLSRIVEYDKFKTEILKVYIPDIQAATDELNRLMNRHYSLLDCLSGLLYMLFGIQISFRGEKSIDCVALAIRVIRAGGGVVAPEIDSSCFTPLSLYVACKQAQEVSYRR